MQTVSVFNYLDPRLFLVDYLDVVQKSDPKFSVRVWAKKMKMKSHAQLLFLLQGKRPIKLKHVEFLQNGLDLLDHEMAYLKSIILYQVANSDLEKKFFKSLVVQNRVGPNCNSHQVDNFHLIKDWIYSAILSMAHLKNFDLEAGQIKKMLRPKVTLIAIKSALERLVSLGLLQKDEKGQLKSRYDILSTQNDVPSEAVKYYHKEVCQLAKSAVDEVDASQREFQSLSLAIPRQNLGLAKEMIREFKAKFIQAISGNGDGVYQLNIHFFQLTKGPQDSEDDGVEADQIILQRS